MSGKYIVRQPIKDAAGNIIGNEILYHGANLAFNSDSSTSSEEFAAANTIYNFLTQSSKKTFKGTLNFMTFTTMLLMKKTPRLFLLFAVCAVCMVRIIPSGTMIETGAYILLLAAGGKALCHTDKKSALLYAALEIGRAHV